ncbi:Methyltransferase type 11 [Mycena kentingensis (nom. inval.)]|nr:Methyltransferase type 11 [Mycena kentingensis (nom. inval.)]
MSTANKERFNAEAAAWDSNPSVQKASQCALEALRTAIPSLAGQTGTGTGPDILEIGCGTGVLSLRLAATCSVSSILAVDAAEGMIAALEHKLATSDAQYTALVQPLCITLTDPEDARLPPSSSSESTRKKYDLVLSHLVLHHIADLRALLTTMLGCLRPGGSIALTDFEDFGPAARKFHPENKMAGVERHGIHAESFAKLIREVGFVDVDVRVAWTLEKGVERFPGEFENGKPAEMETMEFPFLLCRGTKPAPEC